MQLGVAVARLDRRRDRGDRAVEGLAQALHEPQVLRRERELGGDRRDRAPVRRVERPQPGAFDHEHADRLSRPRSSGT